MWLPASQGKDIAQLLRPAREAPGVYDLQAAGCKKPECDVCRTTCYRACLAVQKKMKEALKMINVQPLSGGGILLRFSWYSQYTNSTNIWAIIQLNPPKK